MTVRLDRITTRVGDAGTTRIAGGEAFEKHSPRIEAIGAIDELNSFLGLARTHHRTAEIDGASELLLEIQQRLFDLGAWIATDASSSTARLCEDHVIRLESVTQELNQTVPPLTSFVLPGADEFSALLHVCRTVCRRAERDIVRLARESTISPLTHIYLNRLSDLIFVLGRAYVTKAGIDEILWDPKR